MRENDHMKWHHAPALSVLTGVFAAVSPAVAHADCGPLTVEADANVRGRWPDLPARIQQAFEMRADVDACARVELTMTDPAIVLKVILPDGRAAARSVLRREDVLATLEALLLLPESTTSEPPVRAEAAARPETKVVVVLSEAPHREADRPTSFRIEIAMAAGARAGDGRMGVGFGLASFVDLAHWLLGFQGRLDRYLPMAGGPPTMALELDALAGRRFGFGTTTLDLVAGPALALRGGETMMVTQVTSTAAPVTRISQDQGLPRLVVASRLSFRARSPFRTFVQLDGEVGRTESAAPLPDQAHLPVWTVGLAIGAAVGTR